MEKEKSSRLLLEDGKAAYLLYLTATLLSVFTLSLLYPFARWGISSYFVPRKYIDGRQLKYTGKLWACFLIYYAGLASVLVCVIIIETILRSTNLLNSIPHQSLNAIPGLLGTLFVSVMLNRYDQKNTHFADVDHGNSGFKFHLSLWLGKHVLTKIIAVMSVALLYPVTSRMSAFYDYKRGYIDDRRFQYKFSFKKMYPRYLLDLFLTAITVGLYFPKMMIRRMESDQQYVHIAIEPVRKMPL